jgi:hypothetical protein
MGSEGEVSESRDSVPELMYQIMRHLIANVITTSRRFPLTVS